MKKIILLLTASIIYLNISAIVIATSPNDINYLMTGEGIVFVKSLRNGFNNKLIAKNEFGERMRIDKDDVIAYRKKGKEYRKLIYVEEGANSVSRTFLEKMFTRAGYTIYKRPNVSATELKLSDFYVFQGDQFEFQLNEENYKTVLSFFFSIFNKMFMS